MDQKTLKEYLKYDENSGIFTRIKYSGKGTNLVGKTAGRADPRGYVIIGLLGRYYNAHRLAWLYVYGQWPYPRTDHINRNKSDNRIKNLREATASQNSANTDYVRASSGVRGVRQRKGKFEASVQTKGKYHYLGIFDTIDEAAAVRVEKAKEIFGEFIR